MASNPYVNKVDLANGTTLIDLSQDTVTQADVAQGKYFHLPTGQRVQGTASGGGGTGGTIYQDQDGYLVLSPDGDLPTLITKTITQNGTYDAEDDNADGYSSVTVNVSGGGGGETPFPYGTITFVNNRAVTVSEEDASISGVFGMLYCNAVGRFIPSGEAGYFGKNIQPGESVKAYFIYTSTLPYMEIDNNADVVISDPVNFSVTPDEYWTTYDLVSTAENFTLTVTFT